MHLYSTLFLAQVVDQCFRNEKGLRIAARWCKASGLQKVYVESFRSGVFIKQALLEKVRDFFENAGFTVHGCVTTNGLPRVSNNWENTACYSSSATRERLTEIFRRTAAVFDTVIVDDFLFTDCTCELCSKAKGDSSFSKYRIELMQEVCRENILYPAHEVNPSCKVIIKYPLWYDTFHQNGYAPELQTRDFDRIWAGTETREPDSIHWGRYPQTQAFFFMAWANRHGGGKCMGGWFDTYGCKTATYLEQARQTVLAQAKESMLYCYYTLNIQQEIEEAGYDEYTPGIANINALRRERAGLDRLAFLTETKEIVGVSIPKPAGFDAPQEPYLSSFYGMLGIPVNPADCLDEQALSVILGAQAAGFKDAILYLSTMRAKSVPVVCSKGFENLTGCKSNDGMPVMDPGNDNWSLMDLPEEELNALRDVLTHPLGLTLRGPTRVALNLYDQDLEILQNFNDFDVCVTLDLFGRSRKARELLLTLSEDRQVSLTRNKSLYTIHLPARTLAVLG